MVVDLNGPLTLSLFFYTEWFLIFYIACTLVEL